MNQIVHIFRKDCRHLWQIIAAVFVFTFLHGYGEATIPAGSGMAVGLSPYMIVFILVSLSGLILPVLFFLLVVSVIQEESLVGSDKFWLTRPYDRVSLFLEKLLFVVLWAFLPMLVHDVVLIRHFGFPLSSALGLLLWKYAQFGFFLLLAATLAVLSATFARAVLLIVVAFVIAALIFYVVLYLPSAAPAASMTAAYEILAALAVAAVGALCVIAFQYRFRITPVAAVIGVISIFACALLSRFWPSSLTAYLSHRNDSPLLQSVQLLPDPTLGDLPRPRPAYDAGDQARTSYYPFRAIGLSEDPIDLVGIAAQFESPGQKPAQFFPSAKVRFQPLPGDTIQFADAGGPDQMVPFAPNFPGDYERLKNASGVMSGKLFLEAFRTAIARVPLPSPKELQDFVIAGRQCKVGSHRGEQKLVLIFDCVELEPGNTSRFQVRLLQNNRGIPPSQTKGDSSSAGSWPAFLSPILRTSYTCEFAPPGTGSDSSGDLTQGQEMLVFAEQSLGTAVREFRIDHFRPAELSLQAWEQRGVLKAEPTATQSTAGTIPETR